MGRELLGGLFFFFLKSMTVSLKLKGLKMFLYSHGFHRHTHIDIYMYISYYVDMYVGYV